MKKYGYDGAGRDSAMEEMMRDDEDKALKMLIMRFQDRHGLTVSGEADAETMSLMEMSRCGMKENWMELLPMETMEDMESMGGRRRRKRFSTRGT